MFKKEKKILYGYTLANLLLPPFIWVGGVWLTEWFSTRVVQQLISNPLVPITVIGLGALIFYILKRFISYFEKSATNETLPENFLDVNITFERFLILYGMIYNAIGAAIIQVGVVHNWHEFFIGWLFTVPIMFLFIAPFSVAQMIKHDDIVNSFTKKLPEEFKGLSLRSRFIILFSLNIIGIVIFNILSVYAMIERGMIRDVMILKLFAFSAFAFTFIFRAQYQMFNWVSTRIEKSKKFALEIASGNLLTNLNIEGREDVAYLMQAMLKIKNDLIQIISVVKAMAEQLAASSSEIASTTDSFSKSTQHQAASFEEITSSIEEMSANSEGIMAIVKEQVNKLENIYNFANKLNESISFTIESIENANLIKGNLNQVIDGTNKILDDASEIMDKTIQSSSGIREILVTIDDIADKVNLLSLNASIEAARAGEAGKGFGIIADEISKLADKTASNSKEISGLATTMMSYIKETRSKLSEVISATRTIIKGLEEFGEHFTQIREYSNNDIKLNKQLQNFTGQIIESSKVIENAVNEQARASIEISKNVSDSNLIVQENASNSEELLANAENLNSMAEELNTKVGYFKL